ncbi:MAG: 30S ribosomal protein S20 [Kiritimatiellae bacterium]|nr:30S ribosomal protein S20 [Kiritimatiellia bacterium]
MPNIKSAIKRVKTAEKSHERNVRAKSELKTVRKALLDAVAGDDPVRVRDAYGRFCSKLDKAAKHGIIPKNTAIRKKNRAGAMIRKAAAAAK